MTLSQLTRVLAAVLLLGAISSPAHGAREPDPSLEQFRLPFDQLLARSIATTSRAVRFDWRDSTLGIGAQVSQLSELNTFRSGRYGLLLRTPLGRSLLGELGLSYVRTTSTQSSETLALTPFRQAGRPSRLEVELNLSLPLAEGVVTTLPSFVPPLEMVFSLTTSLRYAYYRGSQNGLSLRRSFSNAFRPSLTQQELDNLESRRLGGMVIDPARFALMAGFTQDIYFSSGAFISPRAMLNIPLGGITETTLSFWWEISVAAGWTF